MVFVSEFREVSMAGLKGMDLVDQVWKIVCKFMGRVRHLRAPCLFFSSPLQTSRRPLSVRINT